MELILIDSGLVNKAGHSYTLAKTVSDALARRQLRYPIFGLSGLDTPIAAEIGAIPHFSRSLAQSSAPVLDINRRHWSNEERRKQ